jgi:hypothetical protein
MKSKKGSIVKESKDGEKEKLKSRIRRLESDNKTLVTKYRKLLSEIKTLESYREVTSEHIGNKLDGIPVEKVIRSVEEKQKAKKRAKEDAKSKEVCPACYGPIKVISFRAGKVKTCSNDKCNYRVTEND